MKLLYFTIVFCLGIVGANLGHEYYLSNLPAREFSQDNPYELTSREELLLQVMQQNADGILSDYVSDDGENTLLMYSSRYGDLIDAFDFSQMIKLHIPDVRVKQFGFNNNFDQGNDYSMEFSEDWVTSVFDRYYRHFDNLIYLNANEDDRFSFVFINLLKKHVIRVPKAQCQDGNRLRCAGDTFDVLAELYEKDKDTYLDDIRYGTIIE